MADKIAKDEASVIRVAFPGGDKTYTSGMNIVTINVTKGLWLVTFSPGYCTTSGAIAILASGTNTTGVNKNINMTVSGGWCGTISGVFTIYDNDAQIKMQALENVAWQGNHSDFVAIRISE